MFCLFFSSSDSTFHRPAHSCICLSVFLCRSLDSSLAKFVKDFLDLANKLAEVCNRKCDNMVQSLSMDKDFRSLVRLVSDRYGLAW